MSKYSDEELYQALTETGRLLRDVSPVEGEEYSLDAILAEFGRGAAKPAQKEVAPEPEKPEEPTQEPPAQEEKAPKAETAPEEKDSAEEPEEIEEPVRAEPALMSTQSLRQVLAANRRRVAERRAEPEKEPEPKKEPEAKKEPEPKEEPEVEKKPAAAAPAAEQQPEEVPAEEKTPEETPAEEPSAPERKVPSRLIARKRPSWRVVRGGQGRRTEENVSPAQEEAPSPIEDLRDTKELLPKKKKAEPVPAPKEEVSKASPVFPEEPEGMHKVPLEQVMSQTVESVLDEDDAILERPEPLGQRAARTLGTWREKLSGLLSRTNGKADSPWERQENEPDPENEPEPDMELAAKEERRLCKRLHLHTMLSAVPALLLAILTILDGLGALKSLWSGVPALRYGLPALLLLATALLVSPVWEEMLNDLRRGRIGCELGAALTALVVLGDCIYGILGPGGGPAPFAAPAAALVWLCQLGLLLAARARYDAFHLADIGGNPPYGVSVTAAGACKQKGTLEGFYRSACRPDPARRWQRILVPLILAVATVLAGMVVLSGKTASAPLWVWSALLTASLPLALPLTGSLPIHYLNQRLIKSGSAVAGYAGARAVSRSRRMVVTDDDLFPPGTVGLNGLKVYGEEIGKVVSYAASMTQACHSQLYPLFEQLLTAEGGDHLPVEDLHYFEEGGVGGTIHGESVTMGSAYFMRKKHVTLPQELKLKTGVFLAVDGALIAIFAIKYSPSRNVEWALRALRRNRIEPVMAVRSCNVTPGLLKRRFNLDVKPVYPDVSTRLALSDLSRETAEKASAIIYRDGLMPLAETAVGSRRMLRATRSATVLAWVGSLCGALLAYYFTNAGAYQLLDPLRMLVFQGLWLLPTGLLSGLVRHY